MGTRDCYEIDACACTAVGRVREINEDSFLVADLTDCARIEDCGTLKFFSGRQGSLFAVADGMGGAAVGEVASQLCLETLYDEVQATMSATWDPTPESAEQILIDAVGVANRRVFEVGHSHDEYAGMGTTLTAVLELRGNLVIGQIGDSRAYLIRKDGIRQLTRDQSLVTQMVEEGEITQEQARHHPERNILLQALGVRATVEVALKSARVYPDDVLLLCSDGLHSQLRAKEIWEIVLGNGSLREACQELIDLANERGGPDNITSLLIRFIAAE
jgi:protein phosphatase